MELSKDLERLKKKILKEDLNNMTDIPLKGYYMFWINIIMGIENGCEFILKDVEGYVEYPVKSISVKRIVGDVEGKEVNFNGVDLEGCYSIVYKQSRKEKFFILSPKK